MGISAAIIGIITFNKSIVPTDLPLELLFIALGAFGAINIGKMTV